MSNKFRNLIEFMWIITLKQSFKKYFSKIFFCTHNFQTCTFYAFLIYKYSPSDEHLITSAKILALYSGFTPVCYLVIPAPHETGTGTNTTLGRDGGYGYTTTTLGSMQSHQHHTGRQAATPAPHWAIGSYTSTIVVKQHKYASYNSQAHECEINKFHSLCP